MVLITILAIIVALLLVFIIAIGAIGGTLGIIVFADVIVCILFIIWLIKKLLKR